jgi:FtsP/CotA-like multicopper oxidase with cupredoxin domain
MLLDTAEEWTISNSTSGIFHPFHIHINPFQITEIFDPTTMNVPLRIPPPWIWWDTFGLPPAAVPPGESAPKNGYIKMLTRFVDFPGSFVDHCHILAHEDRGMMQLIEVVPNTTVLSHH